MKPSITKKPTALADPNTTNLLEGNTTSDVMENEDAYLHVKEFISTLSDEELNHARKCIDEEFAGRKDDPETSEDAEGEDGIAEVTPDHVEGSEKETMFDGKDFEL